MSASSLHPFPKIVEAVLGRLSSDFPAHDAFVSAMNLASISCGWRKAFLNTSFASLVTIDGLKHPFQTGALLAKPIMHPVDIKLDIDRLHSYPFNMAYTALRRALKDIRSISTYTGALNIRSHASDDPDFDVTTALNILFFGAADELYFPPPVFILDYGRNISSSETYMIASMESTSDLYVQTVFQNWSSFASARSIRRLSITNASSLAQRLPLHMLYGALAQCAGTLEILELDQVVEWLSDGNVYDPMPHPVDLVALKTLSLGYQLVHEAIAVMSVINIPKVDTLSLRDSARDLPPGYENNATALLCLIAQKKEESDYCVRLSLTNVDFDDVPLQSGERLASYFLRTVCAADALNLLYDEKLAHRAEPFIEAMGRADVAVGTKYLRVQGVDYWLLRHELVRRFVRAEGDDLDESILEPAHVDIMHSEMSDPEKSEEFIQSFVTSGLGSFLRVRSGVLDDTGTGTRWEPSTPLASQWHVPLADERGRLDPEAYRVSKDVEMSVEEQVDRVVNLEKVAQLLKKLRTPQ